MRSRREELLRPITFRSEATSNADCNYDRAFTVAKNKDPPQCMKYISLKGRSDRNNHTPFGAHVRKRADCPKDTQSIRIGKHWESHCIAIRNVNVQRGASGFKTGKGGKLSYSQAASQTVSQAGCARLLLSFSLFPGSNPTAPPCTIPMTVRQHMARTTLFVKLNLAEITDPSRDKIGCGHCRTLLHTRNTPRFLSAAGHF